MLEFTERNISARYQQMPIDELYSEAVLWENRVQIFLKTAGYPDDLKYIVDVRAVVEIIIRLDKRMAYYSFFHNGSRIHEMKRVGILVYWLLKFKPFTIVDDRITDGTFNVTEATFELNELFAAYLVYSGLLALGKLKTTPKKSDELHRTLLYAFKYRELSQDSMMTLTYSLYNILPSS